MQKLIGYANETSVHLYWTDRTFHKRVVCHLFLKSTIVYEIPCYNRNTTWYFEPHSNKKTCNRSVLLF